MIKVKSLFKEINNSTILHDINLTIDKGSIYGLIGPNGAGKSTFMKVLAGIIKPDKGIVTINSHNIFDNTAVKETIGYVSDNCHYIPTYTVNEVLKMCKYSYPKFNKERFDDFSKTFEIPLNKKVQDLSKGMKSRLSLIMNLCITPEILILDEPTAGLDVRVKKDFINLLLDEASLNGTTIVISSHNLSDVERICDQIALIDRGSIKYQNTIENMKQTIKRFQVVFENTVPDNFHTITGLMSVEQLGRVCRIIVNKDLHSLNKRCKELGAILVEEIDLNLEDIFILLTGGHNENIK